MEKYILTKPINYDGKKITEIEMDLENLSVEDLERAERIAKALIGKKQTMLMPEFNRKYQACVASIASKLPVEAIRSLGGKDYTQICIVVSDFLLGGDSMEDEENLIETYQTELGEMQTSKTIKTSEQKSS